MIDETLCSLLYTTARTFMSSYSSYDEIDPTFTQNVAHAVMDPLKMDFGIEFPFAEENWLWIIGEVMRGAYAFILGHEIGHRYMAYSYQSGKSVKTSNIDEEFACDRFALDLVASLFPERLWALGTGAYLFFKVIEARRVAMPLDQREKAKITHPAPHQRLERIVSQIHELKGSSLPLFDMLRNHLDSLFKRLAADLSVGPESGVAVSSVQ